MAIIICLVLCSSGCIMDDIESMINILDQNHPGSFDLEILGITLAPENPGAGEMVEVSVTIANRGRKRSKDVPLCLTIGNQEVSRSTVPPINGGNQLVIALENRLALPSGITTLKLDIGTGEDSDDAKRHNDILATTIVVGEPSNTSQFSWSYGGLEWYLTLRSPAGDIRVLDQERPIYSYDDYLEFIKPGDRTVSALADALSFYTDHMEYQSYDEVSFILAFVQELPYTSDLEYMGRNFPRYPIETLIDGTGDCEDSSALFASVVSNSEFFNYGAALIIIDDHMGVGVSGNEGVGGVYFQVQTSSRRYYYCETTGRGYAIGDMPEDYQGAEIQELIEIH